MRRAGIIRFIIAVTCALLVTGCAPPPPALPTSVLAQGADALPEEHPKLTEQQISLCGQCHRASDAPAP